MTNEEKALELMPTKSGYYEITDALLKMAEWKDEQLKEQRCIIRNHWQEWAEEQKQALIDKACEWMCEFLRNHYIMRYEDCCEPCKDRIVEEFKQAMKGGE